MHIARSFLLRRLVFCLLLLTGIYAQAGFVGLEIFPQAPNTVPNKGARIIHVAAGSPADQAGLQPGDVVLSYDGKAVPGTRELLDWIKATPGGRPVHVRYWRAGETLELVLIPGDPPETIRDYREAHALATKGHYQEALRIIDRLVEQDTAATAPRFLRTWIYFQLKQYRPVIQDMDSILSRHELEPAYSYRADAHRLQQQYDEAIRDYNAAIRLQPDKPALYNRRGICYEEKGDLDRALFEYTRSIEVDSSFPYGYKNRADIFRQQGKQEQASQEYRIAAKMLIQDGIKLKKEGSLNTAIDRYTTAISLKTSYSPGAYYNRGLAYEAKKEYPHALNDYTEAIRLNPRSAEAYLRRGFVYAQVQKDYQRAESDWRTAARLDPDGNHGRMAQKNLEALKKIRPSEDIDEEEDW
jgi:tetratricopeptide (TPR) repeat protein